jgi:hypothetical protein
MHEHCPLPVCTVLVSTLYHWDSGWREVERLRLMRWEGEGDRQDMTARVSDVASFKTS